MAMNVIMYELYFYYRWFSRHYSITTPYTPLSWQLAGYGVHSQYTHGYLMGSRIHAGKVDWLPDCHGQWGIKKVVAHGLGLLLGCN